jgi:hypothetical protein
MTEARGPREPDRLELRVVGIEVWVRFAVAELVEERAAALTKAVREIRTRGLEGSRSLAARYSHRDRRGPPRRDASLAPRISTTEEKRSRLRRRLPVVGALSERLEKMVLAAEALNSLERNQACSLPGTPGPGNGSPQS